MKTLSAITPLNLPLIIFFLYFYPVQVFSFQEMGKLSTSTVARDNNLNNSEAVLVSYMEKNNFLRDAEGDASLQIYINGYVSVYYPPYMRRAGKYGLYLDQSDMERLWALLTGKYILGFNKETVRQLLYTADQSKDDELSNVTDTATTLIEIYPNRYKLIGFGDGGAEAMKKISWYGLRWDAKKYLEIPEIQDLITLQQELQAIMRRADLQKVE